jgi:hypothetical protein
LNPDIPWYENHELAEREVREGWKWQRFVVDALEGAGVTGLTPGPEVWRERYGEHDPNEIDLVWRNRRVSIKSRNLRWTGVDDLPYDLMICDTVKKWKIKDPTPWAVLMVSRPTGAIVGVDGKIVGRHEVLRRYDRLRGYEDDFYAVPKCCFVSFECLCLGMGGRRC